MGRTGRTVWSPPGGLGAYIAVSVVNYGISNTIPTFGYRCLSAIGGRKQRSRLAGWVQLSAEAAPGPHGVPPAPVCAENSGAADENIYDTGNLHK